MDLSLLRAEPELIGFVGAGLLAVCILMLLLVVRKNGGLKAQAGILQERLRARDEEITALQQRVQQINLGLDRQREDNISLREQVSQQQALLDQERSQHQEKLDLLQGARDQMSLEFRNLANDILEQKGRSFTDLNKQNIQAILSPLGDKIRLFEKKVEETYQREANERFSLAREIHTLQDLNTRISEDAVNLTNALKGESKTQGIWGEVILERILEKSGLTKGREYDVQVSLKNSQGRNRQPDVVIHLPEGRHVVVDSKVSLSAYERYCREDDAEQGRQHLKHHIQSLRKHIRELADKDYSQLESLQSLDFVLMFLPVEAAFTLAMEHDSSLCTDAFEKQIVLVGPSTLLATLRTIQNIWRHEYQNRHALEIASRAGALYDKFVGFVEDLEEVGQRLEQSQVAYEEAHKKLGAGRGNLVSQVERLKQLGARASKQLPAALLEDAEALADEQAIDSGIGPAGRASSAPFSGAP